MTEISVIIPCFNNEKYISECLDSVLAQTWTDFEVVVINDGSTDKSLAVIQEYADKDKRIKIIDQENQGVVIARNNGIKKAVSKYLFLLDADDKIALDCLTKLYQAMQKNKADVIYPDTELFGEKTGILKLNKPTKRNFVQNNCLAISALFKKSDAIKYGGFDENMKEGLEDWEFWCNFICDNKLFYKIEEPLFFYRQKNNSRNTLISKETDNILRQYIYKKHPFFWATITSFVSRFFYQTKTTKSGKHIIKICKIPIYSRRFLNDKF